MSNDSSSPTTDFAFEPPLNHKPTPGTIFNNVIPSSNNNNNYYGMPYSAYSNGSSFSSSTSGSIGGASFSSNEALPAISRDFTRPAPSETRRPATAGGALQTRSPFGGFLDHGDRKDTIVEEGNGMFMNPFDSTDKQVNQPDSVDPRFVPNTRRASEGQQGSMPPPSWPVQSQQDSNAQQSPVYPLASAPPNFNTFNIYSNIPTAVQRPQFGHNQQMHRPQTSDGLPSFGGPTSLPSARSVVGSVDGFNPMSGGLAPAAQIRNSFDSHIPFRDRVARPDGELTFVPLGGPAPKKRPRRRYDEIERLYLCGWNGCEKAYGTLNHLNAHVAMQKHGEKRLPSEFKDMRKAWRKKKREQAAAASGGHYTGGSSGWRSSISSDSDFGRRESTASMNSDGRYGTTPSVYSYDSRPTTADSMISSTDGRFNTYPGSAPASQPTTSYGFGSMMGIAPPASSSRRSSIPQHIAMPSQPIGLGFRQNDDGPTPTQQNPFPIQNNSMIQQQHQQQQQQQAQFQHQPLQQQIRPMSSGPGIPMSQGFPFQTLTQPMPMTTGQQYGQFAFQR